MKILNLADIRRTEIPYGTFFFPDGQPHFRLDNPLKLGEWEHIQVITRISNSYDIVMLGLAVDALRSVCKGRISVNISWLMGARMDRAIGYGQSITLRVVSGLVNMVCLGASDVRILDPHSQKSIDAIARSTAIAPDALVAHAIEAMTVTGAHGKALPVVVYPDDGASTRYPQLLYRVGAYPDVACCSKQREPETGALSGFKLEYGDVKGRTCLIVDDICDGGGTFVGISKVLREAGATSVALCVTHGVFSKGLPIEGIDHVFTTDSYPHHLNSDMNITVLDNYLENWVRGPKGPPSVDDDRVEKLERRAK